MHNSWIPNPTKTPVTISGQTLGQAKVNNDHVDLKLPSGVRLTASGQMVVAAVSITVICLFACEKSVQVILCITRRINAQPAAPE